MAGRMKEERETHGVMDCFNKGGMPPQEAWKTRKWAGKTSMIA
jgi:hypothetical protein